MFFGKVSIILLIVTCVAINAQKSFKRRTTKTNVKKTSQKIAPSCGCQNPLIDFNCGCRGVLDAAFAPFAPIELAIASPVPIIDVPNYRYADPIEFNPLGCLFPTLEIPNYGILASPMTQTVEYFAPEPCPRSCGCTGPQCSCRAPSVKLPSCAGSVTTIEVPKCGCQGLSLPTYSYGISSMIEMPSYGPSLMSVPACGCRGSPCGCSEIQILPVPACGCQGPRACSGMPMSTCGCLGACECGLMPISSCECIGPCMCSGMPLQSCGCNGPCGCSMSALPALPCGCMGTCGCSGMPMSIGYQLPAVELPAYACGCSMPNCGCSAPSCGCNMPNCGCNASPCGCNMPGCGCSPKYLRQVTLQPPFL